jgi:hypothetical protein
MDKRARAYLDLEERKPPHWAFTGFTTPGLTDEDVIRSWDAYSEHGVLLVPGAFLDQPPEWWNDIETCDMMYATRKLVNEPEYQRKLEAQAKNGRTGRS